MLYFQQLKKGQIVTVHKENLFLRVSRGQIWLTQSNDSADYIVSEGAILDVTPNSNVVIEALEDSTVFYSEQKSDLKPETTQAGARSAAAAVVEERPARTASAR